MLVFAALFALFGALAATLYHRHTYRLVEKNNTDKNEKQAEVEELKKATLTHVVTRQSGGSRDLKILAFNTANYDDHADWSSRLELMTTDMVNLDPDIITLTEIRLNPDNQTSTVTYQNMAEQILLKLETKSANYKGATLVYHPICFYPLMANEMYVQPKAQNSQNKSHLWEGLAVIVKPTLRVANSAAFLWPYANGYTDKNKRGAQAVSICIDEASGSCLTVLNTHWGLDLVSRIANAHSSIDILSTDLYNNNNRFVMCGDLNADPTDASVLVLTQGTQKVQFVDSWAATHDVKMNPGYTIPSNAPDTRIDYIWTAKGTVTPQSTQLAMTRPDANNIYASDHVGVMATVSVAF